ncbi:hypothetical protein GGI42DRAFT_175650 [Trichoderma sp. SZMC 28013]
MMGGLLSFMLLGEWVTHWTQNWVFSSSRCFLLGLVDLTVVEFWFSFPATTLLCFTRLDCFIFFSFYTLLSSLITLPWKSGNGNLLWVFLGRDFGENSWVVEQKHKREWEIHKKLRLLLARFFRFFLLLFLKQERS